MPSYQFSTLAMEYLHARGDPNRIALISELAACCRAYTRVVLRLRTQAEAEARNPSSVPAVAGSQAPSSPPSRRAPSLQRGTSRASSRAPSVSPSYTATVHHVPVRAAQSPLFRLRRAPLLRIFVPSPDGDWLSDESVVTCENELKKAGVAHLMRAGDVVWDVAVGDESNIGRMVWDGAYLLVSGMFSRSPPRNNPLSYRTSTLRGHASATFPSTCLHLLFLLLTSIVSFVRKEAATLSVILTLRRGAKRSRSICSCSKTGRELRRT